MQGGQRDWVKVGHFLSIVAVQRKAGQGYEQVQEPGIRNLGVADGDRHGLDEGRVFLDPCYRELDEFS